MDSLQVESGKNFLLCKCSFSLLVLFLKGNEYEEKEWGGSIQLRGDCQILWAATVSVKK